MTTNVKEIMLQDLGSVDIVYIDSAPWFLGSKIAKMFWGKWNSVSKSKDVAYGLGFTKNDIKFSESGFRKEYVRIDWTRISKYLTEFNFPNNLGKDYSTSKDLSEAFIPKNIFYRLAMKAKNPAEEAFQAKVADEIIPSIRRTGGYISGEKEMDDDELVARAFVVL